MRHFLFALWVGLLVGTAAVAQAQSDPEHHSSAHHGHAPDAKEQLPDFTQAYVDAMDEMHGPMMDGILADDPDLAFVLGMIPHHQGAVEMARTVLEYGRDPQIAAWAEEMIETQEREIAEMEAWLEKQK
ncbi:MAG TPA: DUF305 domain-containing protein [Kiloniellales bacterium]|nr:DUF305 domain-containing protein [Kiloniellales bacterium]